MSMERHIVHLHIPAFPISVARVAQPDLRNRPVAVAPARSERALLVSVSLEARREGVFKGMPLSRAKKQCPGLRVLPYEPWGIEKAFQGVSEAAAQYTPLWEPSRPGHIYLDLTGTRRLWGSAKDTGYRLQKEIKARFDLSATVGISGNKMVSSIASRIRPLFEVLQVGHGEEASFMAPLKVGVIPGIGRVRQKVLLEELNISRVRELAALERQSLTLLFGGYAEIIRQRTLGIDPTPVYPSVARPIIRDEITLAEDENDDVRLLGVLLAMVERCAYRMRQKEVFPKRAGLLLRYADQMEARGQVRLSGGTNPRELYRIIEKLFLARCRRRVRVRFLGIWFWDFSPVSRQLSLFSSPEADRDSRLIQAMDRIRERYGRLAYGYEPSAICHLPSAIRYEL